MINKIALFFLVGFYSFFAFSAPPSCPLLVEPVGGLATFGRVDSGLWKNYTKSGKYKYSSYKYYVQVEVVENRGRCSDISTIPSGLSRQYCISGEPDSPGTVVFGKAFKYQCADSDFYKLNKESMCQIIDENTCPLQFCEDGFPPDLLGYSGCDRPPLKRCEDGSIILESGICPIRCTDYDSCYVWAEEEANCAAHQFFKFGPYVNAGQFSFSCVDIDPDSPDHPDNGGNADGNNKNDPNSGEGTGVGDLDIDSLANAIDDKLQNDFGNVERAIRDDIEQSKNNTDALKTAIEESGSNLEEAVREGILEGLNDSLTVNGSIATNTEKIEKAVRDSIASNKTGTNQITSKLDDSNSLLQQIANNTAANGSGESDGSTEEDGHGLETSFLETILNQLTDVFTTSTEDEKSHLDTELDNLKNDKQLGEDQLDGVFDSFLRVFPNPTACQPLKIFEGMNHDLTITCQFSDQFKVFFGFIIYIYTVLQLINILMTGITPRPQGGT